MSPATKSGEQECLPVGIGRDLDPRAHALAVERLAETVGGLLEHRQLVVGEVETLLRCGRHIPAVSDHVESVEPHQRLADGRRTEMTIERAPADCWVGQYIGDRGRMRRPHRSWLIESGSRWQLNIVFGEEVTLGVDDVADDVTGSPAGAWRRRGPAFGGDRVEHRTESGGEIEVGGAQVGASGAGGIRTGGIRLSWHAGDVSCVSGGAD